MSNIKTKAIKSHLLVEERVDTPESLKARLCNFIMENEEKDTSRQTHMWFGNKGNRILFRVEDEDYEDFVNLVAKATDRWLSNPNNEALHVLELPLEVGMFCIDLDIKFSKKKSHFDLIEPLDIIEKINKIVKTYFTLDDKKKQLKSYYFIKKNPFYDKEKKVYSDGIHIIYPNLILDPQNKNFIFDLLIDEIVAKGDFDVLLNELLIDKYQKENKIIHYDEEANNFIDEYKNIIDITDDKMKIINGIFDRCVFKKTKWFMYGSGKDAYKNKDIYKIKYILDYDCDIINEIPCVQDLVKILAIRNGDKEQILTNDTYKRYVESNKNRVVKQKVTNSENKIIINKSNSPLKTNSVATVEIAKKLVKMLNKERAIPYDSWMKVGLCLYGISPTLFPEFIEFSKLSDKFDLAGCTKFWSSCKKPAGDNELTVASLKFWAKEDNFTEYEKLYSEYLNGCSLEDTEKINEILKNLNFEHDHNVALIIKSLYGRLFKCSSVTKQIWYHFNNHRWNYCDAGYKLNNLISEHFTKYIFNMYTELTNAHLKDMNDENIKKKKDIYYKFITKLNKNTYKKTLMAECTNSFYEQNFVYSLDENINLIGFNNGVYDLENKEFRDGLPEDKVTFSTGYNYKDYSMNHPIVIEIENIIKLIQPDDRVRMFMLCHIASFLQGGNKDQKIVFWIGPGGANGKSTIQNLISNSFGRYYKYVENTLITKERGKSNEASPDILELKGVRSVVFSELEPNIKINSGFLKRLTGGDPLKGRDLFSSDILQFIPQFGMILISNILPEFNSVNDNAVWRRIRVISFAQKFVENPKAKNEHKIDNNLPKKLESVEFKSAFMWLLINKYYPIYVDNGLDALTPPCVMESTNRAKTESEPYLKFREEQISYDEESVMDTDTLRSIYNEWYVSTYNRKPTKPAGIIDYFVGEGFVKKGKVIRGIKYELDMTSLSESLKSEFDN